MSSWSIYTTCFCSPESVISIGLKLHQELELLLHSMAKIDEVRATLSPMLSDRLCSKMADVAMAAAHLKWSICMVNHP